MLRSEFINKRKEINRTFKEVNNILINFGGGDDRGLIEKSVNAVLKVNNNIKCDVILGQSNPNKEYLTEFLSKYNNITVHNHVGNMAEFMSKADLAIGSSGSTIWERCCLGLPSIVASISNVEQQFATLCSKKKLVIYMGKQEDITTNIISEKLQSLINNSDYLKQISKNGMAMLDGSGASMVAQKIIELSGNK